MTREELTDKMKDLPNPPSRVHLIQQVWEIMNDENEQLKENFDKLLDFVVERTEQCDVCPLTNTCINSEGVCPYAWQKIDIKDWILKYIGVKND